MPKRVSDEQRARIIDAVRAGNYIKDAVAFAGVSEAVIYKWQDEADNDDNPRDWVVEFIESLRRAKAEAAMVHVQNIRHSALGRPAEYDDQGRLIRPAKDGDWRASGWYLERTRPREWSMTMRQEMDVAVNVSHETVHAKLAEALDALGDLDDEPDPGTLLALNAALETDDGGDGVVESA